MTLPTIFNQVLANLNSGPVNHTSTEYQGNPNVKHSIMSKINHVAYYFQPSASKFEQWACKSEPSENTLRTFQTTPQWLSERRIGVRWTPTSESSKFEQKSSICIRVKQIRNDPTTPSLHEVARLMESLPELINKIQRQHSLELRSFAVYEVNLTGYTDEHNMLQAMITLKK